MRSWIATLGVVCVWGALGLPTARAQIGGYTPPQTNPHPTVSPYLNMMRGNPAINYYGIVRPQMETSRALQQLQLNQNYNQANMNPLGYTDTTNLANNNFITGHPVTFMNLSGYFPLPGTRFAPMGIGTGMGAGIPGAVGNVGGMGAGTQTMGATIFNTQGPQGHRR